MAESVVSSVVQALGDLLIQEAKFLSGVTGQVEQMQFELVLMQSYLEDADKKQYKDKRVQACVSRIRELAYDAEDVIETFALKIASRRGGGLQSAFKRYARITNEAAELHKLGSEIEAIKTHISNLTRSLETYGVTHSIREGEGSSSEQGKQPRLRRSYSHVVEENIVGLGQDTKILVEQLVNEEKKCPVVSIWGMGGLGKTTLAKEVYRHDNIKAHFGGLAWAYISQQCRTRDVLESILCKLISPSQEDRKKIKKSEDDELAKQLYEVQRDKKCLVILDDIWGIEAWKSLSPAFPIGKFKSKLLLTTRIREVAEHVNAKGGFLYELQNLTEDQSWELLQNTAFPRNSYSGSINMTLMENVGRKMVRKCKFLPLAIVVLGGILATKHTVDEWEIVHKNISSYIRGKGLEQPESSGVYEVLALSYNELPYHLKPCFLHLAHYPEDFDISTNKLVRMWVAEGIVSPIKQHGVEEEETIEDVAERYLGELLDRCMVQVGKRGSTGRIKTCRLHDLMRDLCLLTANEENFLKIHLQDRGKKVDSTRVHRLAVYLREEPLKHSPIQERNPHLRSLLFFTTNEFSSIIFQKVQSQIANFKLLKILDLERCRIEGKSFLLKGTKGKLEKAIGNLINLRYLSLNCSFINDIPSSIGNLRFLQTLILNEGWRTRVPKIIWKMEQLRHICFSKYGDYHMNKTCGKVRLGNLSNLQTLRGVGTKMFDINEVTKLTNLRTLSLDDRIVKLPEYPQFPKNLTKLTLEWSKLEEDPMPTLEKLPYLTILRLLRESFIGKEMVCSSKGFPQLKYLYLESLFELEEWRMGEEEIRFVGEEEEEEWCVGNEDTMPNLSHLLINNCKKLKKIPNGLRFITTLRKLEIKFMPKHFRNRLQQGGEDYDKVRHVPSITF